MSNMGLEAALKRNGIRMLRAPVGNRYVLEQMLANNAALGGEQSGHILLPPPPPATACSPPSSSSISWPAQSNPLPS